MSAASEILILGAPTRLQLAAKRRSAKGENCTVDGIRTSAAQKEQEEKAAPLGHLSIKVERPHLGKVARTSSRQP